MSVNKRNDILLSTVDCSALYCIKGPAISGSCFPDQIRRKRIGNGRSTSVRHQHQNNHPLKVAALQPARMTEKRVEFQNRAGDLIVGILLDTGSLDVVILCHGFASHKNGFHLPAFAKALKVKGISSLRLDLSGNGESGGSFKYANIEEEAADIDAAASYLESQSKIPSGLAGHSKGGSSVLLYSAKYGCIPRVANISGRFDHKRGVRERFGDDIFEVVERDGGKLMHFKAEGGKKIDVVFDKKDLNDRMTIDMAEICSRISPDIQILTVHGSHDATIPVEDAHSFTERIPKSQLVVIDGANHNYTEKAHADHLVQLIADFFSRK